MLSGLSARTPITSFPHATTMRRRRGGSQPRINRDATRSITVCTNRGGLCPQCEAFYSTHSPLPSSFLLRLPASSAVPTPSDTTHTSYYVLGRVLAPHYVFGHPLHATSSSVTLHYVLGSSHYMLCLCASHYIHTFCYASALAYIHLLCLRAGLHTLLCLRAGLQHCYAYVLAYIAMPLYWLQISCHALCWLTLHLYYICVLVYKEL